MSSVHSVKILYNALLLLYFESVLGEQEDKVFFPAFLALRGDRDSDNPCSLGVNSALVTGDPVGELLAVAPDPDSVSGRWYCN